jgi:hypothetical protein
MAVAPVASSIVARHRDGLSALALGALFLGLYLLTLCPTVYWYDSAEYAGAAYTFGIPHPPGYPLYTLLAGLFARLPFEPAASVNFMSALFGAMAVALAYLFSRRLGLTGAAAAVGAGTLGASHLFWSQAVIAEVHTTALFLMLAVLLLLERGLRQNRVRPVLVASFVAGLGMGVHYSIATFGIGFALLVAGLGVRIERPCDLAGLARRAGLGRRLAVGAGALGCAGLGACVFLYLPLRASMRPELMAVDASTWDGFWWLVRGGSYGGWFLREYDFLGRAALVGGILYDQLLVAGIALAVAGVARGLSRTPLFALALLAAAAGNLWFFFDYDVHDLDVFFLPAVLVFSLFTGMGAQALFELVSRSARAARLGPVVRVLACALPLSLIAANYRANDRSADTSAREFGEQVSRELPAGSVIVHLTTPPEWRKDAVFAKYFQPVLGRRPDVRILASPDPREVAALVRAGTPVYAYEPEPRIARAFVLRAEGEMYRLLGLRPRR